MVVLYRLDLLVLKSLTITVCLYRSINRPYFPKRTIEKHFLEDFFQKKVFKFAAVLGYHR